MKQAHFFVNCTENKGVVLRSFPCATCGRKVRPIAAATRVADFPVVHSFQSGKCPGCGSQHFVASARTTEDCIKLEPLMQRLVESAQEE